MLSNSSASGGAGGGASAAPSVVSVQPSVLPIIKGEKITDYFTRVIGTVDAGTNPTQVQVDIALSAVENVTKTEVGKQAITEEAASSSETPTNWVAYCLQRVLGFPIIAIKYIVDGVIGGIPQPLIDGFNYISTAIGIKYTTFNTWWNKRPTSVEHLAKSSFAYRHPELFTKLKEVQSSLPVDMAKKLDNIMELGANSSSYRTYLVRIENEFETVHEGNKKTFTEWTPEQIAIFLKLLCALIAYLIIETFYRLLKVEFIAEARRMEAFNRYNAMSQTEAVGIGIVANIQLFFGAIDRTTLNRDLPDEVTKSIINSLSADGVDISEFLTMPPTGVKTLPTLTPLVSLTFSNMSRKLQELASIVPNIEKFCRNKGIPIDPTFFENIQHAVKFLNMTFIIDDRDAGGGVGGRGGGGGSSGRYAGGYGSDDGRYAGGYGSDDGRYAGRYYGSDERGGGGGSSASGRGGGGGSGYGGARRTRSKNRRSQKKVRKVKKQVRKTRHHKKRSTRRR